MRETEPSRVPPPSPARLEAATTAVLVLDLTAPREPPDAERAKLLANLGAFLERARAAAVPIFFTGIVLQIGAPADPALERRESEPLQYPDGFDKFIGGGLQRWLEDRGTKTLVITGGATNVAVMYTATAALRSYHYQVVIPADGVYSPDAYRYEYALYQLTVLPGGTPPAQFTTLGMIEFS